MTGPAAARTDGLRGPGRTDAPRGLSRFTGPRPPRPEVCELCGVAVPADGHRHLVETQKRALVCACTACSLLFDRPGAHTGARTGRYRAVPDRFLTDPGHRLDDELWELLRIPVGVAFLFHNTALDRPVALYPSPAGATESELDPRTWERVLASVPLAALLAPDTEALLVHRREGRSGCWLVPVDVCYELVGRMRLLWQGFDGGAEAHAALDAFFDEVARRARPVGPATEAGRS
ncbi:DUF5947 family protein [Streptomyces sp. NPDC090085]|uniref:DUF5947 family protein n=1 Tax=Streptomyces sp. NPDC090085 TaxID=3365943 RepID=UPI0037F3EE11